jgi:hypothetical protein
VTRVIRELLSGRIGAFGSIDIVGYRKGVSKRDETKETFTKHPCTSS